MVVPKWIKNRISQDDIQRLNHKILSIEQRSSIELVPMIVRRSSTIGHVATIIYLLLCILTLIFSFGLFLVNPWHWGVDSFTSFEIALAILNWFLAASLAKLGFFQRLLTTIDDRHHQVRKRAELEFLENRLTLLPSQNAVLLMISLMERQVQVIVGDGILVKVPLEKFDIVVDAVTTKLKLGSYAPAVFAGMEKVEELTSSHFPRLKGEVDHNEFADCLILKD